MKRQVHSPQIQPELVAVLYKERCRQQIPMTRLVDRLLRSALRFEGIELTGSSPLARKCGAR